MGSLDVGAEEMDFFHFFVEGFGCLNFVVVFFGEGSIIVETSRFDKMNLNDAVFHKRQRSSSENTSMLKCV